MTASSGADPTFDALVEALLQRIRSGESLDAEAVARQHPRHADRLRAIVPVLVLVERGKIHPTPAAGPEADVGPRRPAVGAPERVGRWRIRGEIGRGGMGRVFDAIDEEGRRAAVKVVHPHLLAVPGTLERFLREAEVGRRVEHPRVVRTLDAGEADVLGVRTPWIALEHVEGRSLRQVLDEFGPLGERLARAVGQGIAEALVAVHAAGLVHRDVKPENVLITPREEVRLMDLGLALARDAAVRLSQTGDFVGTLLYAAPEQLRGLVVGPEADLYALGLLLHELVTGRHPEAVLGAPPQLPGASPPLLWDGAEVSPFFGAVVTGLLDPLPERRLGDAAAVASLLREGESSAWWRGREGSHGTVRSLLGDRSIPLVGRETELARLEDAFASALRGEGRVVLLEGEAGLGKSRLVGEWLARVEPRGAAGLRTALALHAPGLPEDGVPPLSAALREVLGPGALEARLSVLLDEGEPLVRPFADLLRGRAGGEGAALAEASQATAHRLLLRGLAREGPLVVVAEDLDEASETSRRLFLTLARSVERERVVLVATAGPGLAATFRDALRALPHAEVVVLDPLGRDAAHDLFLAAVGGAPTTAPWHEAVRSAGGNPLCLVEWARAARAAPEGLAARPVPEVLRTLLEGRLTSLDPESAHLLAVAACAGDRFDPTTVSVAAGLGRLEGLRRLHRLDREHRLVVADGEAYRFAHALLRTVVHDDLPPALRREIHGALARALEGLPPGPKPGAREAAIASHALRGPRPEDAIPHAEEAIRFLSASDRWRETASLCEALLGLPGPLDRRLEALVWTHLGASRLLFAAPDEVIPPLERGLTLAQALSDQDLALFASLQLAAALGQAGRFEESLDLQRAARDLAERIGRPVARVSAAVGLAAALHDLGRFAEAGEAAARAAALAREAGDPWSAANAAYFVGVVRLATGDLAGARPDLEAAMRGARALGDRSLETSAVTGLSNADFLEGRLDAALEHLERLIALAREAGELRAELVTRTNLAAVQATLGRTALARETAVGALRAAERAGFGSVVVHAQVAVAVADARLGAWGEALETLAAAAVGAAAAGSPVLEAKVASRRLGLLAWTGRFEEALALHAAHEGPARAGGAIRERLALDEGLAEIHVARGDPAGAVAVLEGVLREARERGLVQEITRVSLALGLCRRDLGDAEEARRLLGEAGGRAERSGMRGVAALARVHLATLPGADRVIGRVALSEHADAMGVHPRLLASSALAAVTGDPALRRAAGEDLELLLRSLPEEARAAMRARVPRHGSL